MAFECARCGRCCEWAGAVKVSASEVDAMADFLGITPEVFSDRFLRLMDDRSGLSLVENPDGSCVFYSRETRRCAVNPVKPRQCAGFPVEWNFPGWEAFCAAVSAGIEKKIGGQG